MCNQITKHLLKERWEVVECNFQRQEGNIVEKLEMVQKR